VVSFLTHTLWNSRIGEVRHVGLTRDRERSRGYSGALRRFIQHEGFTPQVNEIANTMPSWISGEDHLINFRNGDPYATVDEGYNRVPGAGW
jgi:hypothetical protein